MFKELDPLLLSEIRLGIMSILMSVEEADFVYLKESTKATSGNLSVQLDKLQQAEYIAIRKTYKGKRPQTICSITSTGRSAFENYVEALRSYTNK